MADIDILECPEPFTNFAANNFESKMNEFFEQTEGGSCLLFCGGFEWI